MQADRTIRVYQGNNQVAEYYENTPSYYQVCSYLGIQAHTQQNQGFNQGFSQGSKTQSHGNHGWGNNQNSGNYPSYQNFSQTLYTQIGQGFSQLGNNQPVEVKHAIKDEYVSNVKMSSWYDQTTKAYKLNSDLAWCASDQTCKIPEQDFIQFDFSVPQTFVGIELQGRKNFAQWVTKFKLMASNNGTNFSYVNYGQEFNGSSDSDTVNKIQIPRFTAQYLRFVPTAYNGWKSCRIDLLIEPSPVPKVAVENVDIRVTLSSYYDENLKKYQLNSDSSWSASDQTCKIPERDYIQVEFKNPSTVCEIDLQGRKACPQWVTKFKLMVSFDGTNFFYAYNGKEFDGNTDNESVKQISIPKLQTKYLRLVPTAFHEWKSCRFAVKILK